MVVVEESFKYTQTPFNKPNCPVGAPVTTLATLAAAAQVPTGSIRFVTDTSFNILRTRSVISRSDSCEKVESGFQLESERTSIFQA